MNELILKHKTLNNETWNTPVSINGSAVFTSNNCSIDVDDMSASYDENIFFDKKIYNKISTTLCWFSYFLKITSLIAISKSYLYIVNKKNIYYTHFI